MGRCLLLLLLLALLQLAHGTESGGAVVAAGPVKDVCEDGSDSCPPAALSPDRIDMMERVLYGLPEPDVRLPSRAEKLSLTPEQYQAALARVWLRRQEEVRAAMEKMDDHGAIVRNLVEQLMDSSSGSDAIAHAIEELELRVDRVDDAEYFVHLGGVARCVNLMAVAESESVRAAAAQLAGSAVKNVPQLQDAALAQGLLHQSLSQLEHRLRACESVECAKTLYAVGSLARGHPRAQAQALELGLPRVLADILSAATTDARALVKAAALAHDSLMAWPDARAAWAVNGTDARACEALRSRAVSNLGEPQSGELRVMADALRQALTALDCQTADLPPGVMLAPADDDMEEDEE